MSAPTPSAVESQRLIVVELHSNRGTYGKSQKVGFAWARSSGHRLGSAPASSETWRAIKAESGGGTLLHLRLRKCTAVSEHDFFSELSLPRGIVRRESEFPKGGIERPLIHNCEADICGKRHKLVPQKYPQHCNLTAARFPSATDRHVAAAARSMAPLTSFGDRAAPSTVTPPRPRRQQTPPPAPVPACSSRPSAARPPGRRPQADARGGSGTALGLPWRAPRVPGSPQRHVRRHS